MTEELVTAVKQIRLQELRDASETYFEAVVNKAELPELEKVCEALMGAPFKHAGASSGWDASRISKPYGGIRAEQTMYLHRDPSGDTIAFLWPWGCGTKVTLKVISTAKPRAVPGARRKPFWKRIFGL